VSPFVVPRPLPEGIRELSAPCGALTPVCEELVPTTEEFVPREEPVSLLSPAPPRGGFVEDPDDREEVSVLSGPQPASRTVMDEKRMNFFNIIFASLFT